MGGSYNNKVDVYSAGTILYQMLFAVCPFVANTEHEIAHKIKKGFKVKPSSGVSSEVQQLLINMLQADPSKRIDLEGVLDFLYKRAEKKRQARLSVYRGLSKTVIGGLGVMGAILGAFNWKDEPSSPSTISNMDLKLYGRLCSKLSSRA
jgi:serine/threonine protein kinase